MPLSKVNDPFNLNQDQLRIVHDQLTQLSTKLTSLLKSQERLLSTLEARCDLLVSNMTSCPLLVVPSHPPVVCCSDIPTPRIPTHPLCNSPLLVKPTHLINDTNDTSDPSTFNEMNVCFFDTTDHSIVTPTCFLMRLYYKFFLFHFAPPWGRCCSFMLVLTFVLNNNQQAAYWTILFLSFPDSFLRLLCFEKDIFFVHFISCVFVYLTIQKKMNI